MPIWNSERSCSVANLSSLLILACIITLGYTSCETLNRIQLRRWYDEEHAAWPVQGFQPNMPFIPRLVAFLAEDRGMGDCVDLPLVVEGISLGEYLMFSNEIWPKLWNKSKKQPPVGDPHNLERGSLGGVRHEAEGRVTDAAWTTELEIVWIPHRWLGLAFIPRFGSNFIRKHEVFLKGNSFNYQWEIHTISHIPNSSQKRH